MKTLFKTLLIIIITLIASEFVQGQSEPDPPSGYTINYGLRQYAEGAYPSADSINKNLVDIDAAIKNRDRRIDTLKTAFGNLHNFPSGTLKNNVINQQHIVLQAVRAIHLDSNIFKRLDGTSHFRKELDGEGELMAYVLKYNPNQIDNDSLAIKPNAVLPQLTIQNFLTIDGLLRSGGKDTLTAANILTPGKYNYALVEGTDNIQEILSDNYTPGTLLFLSFADGCELEHGSGAEAMFLAGETNWATTPNDRILFVFNGSCWEEFSRTDN